MPGDEGLTKGWKQAAGEADLVVELAPGVPLFFRRIPKGSFLMGGRGWYQVHEGLAREEPRHLVVLTQDFFLGTFPVTQKQFAVWSQDHGNKFKGAVQNPAEYLSWDDAMAFCERLTHSQKLPSGMMATLPAEAQWEYACRAGTSTDYHTGDGEAALDAAGWYEANSGGSTQPVGGKAPNAFGLYDLHGNVDEWCLDAWDHAAYRDRPDGVTDPRGHDQQEDSAPLRVLRGGSWNGMAGYCRSAYRLGLPPWNRSDCYGFRVCLLSGPVVIQDRRGAPPGQKETERAGGGGVGGTTTRSRPASEGASPGDLWENLRGPRPDP